MSLLVIDFTYLFNSQKIQFISRLIERTVIDITQPKCPSLTDIYLPAVSCTFSCHNKSKHICVLRTAYKLAQWLTFTFLLYNKQNAFINRYFINVFQMTVWGLIRRTYYLNKQQRKYVSIYLNDGNLKPEVKIRPPFGPAVLNDMQWFILVTFRGDIPNNEVHELGDLQHILSVYCGRYIRITSENIHVVLSKKVWSQLLDLASACTDREVIKYG